MNKFAKLYETELGQILIKQDEGEHGIEVVISFSCEGLGVCNVSLNWPDDDEVTRWKKADSAFEKINEEEAFGIVKSTIDSLGL